MAHETSRPMLRSLGATAFFVLVSATSSTAYAYCRTTTCNPCALDSNGCPSGGVPIAWSGRCVSYSLAEAASRQITLEQATSVAAHAFGAWSGVTCAGTTAPPSMLASNAFGPTVCALHEYNQEEPNANIISFHDDSWPYANSIDTLALTTVTFDIPTGEIYDADIEVNATEPLSAGDPVPPDRYDLQSILTHEAGHFFGLAHSHDPSAVMWPSFEVGADSLRFPSADDTAAICTVYPPVGMSNVTVVSASVSMLFAYGHESSWKLMMFAFGSSWLYSCRAQTVGPKALLASIDGGAVVPAQVTPLHAPKAWAATLVACSKLI